VSQGFLFPFDDAKVRRFSEMAMDFSALCSQTAPFVDKGQQNGLITFFLRFLVKLL